MKTNFELLDYIIFISYGLIILGVGLWVSRNKEGKEKNSEDLKKNEDKKESKKKSIEKTKLN